MNSDKLLEEENIEIIGKFGYIDVKWESQR